MSALDGIESEWRALYDVQRATSYYPSYSSWMAYGTSFIGTIIENLQVPLFYSLRIQVTKLNLLLLHLQNFHCFHAIYRKNAIAIKANIIEEYF